MSAVAEVAFGKAVGTVAESEIRGQDEALLLIPIAPRCTPFMK